MKRYIAWAFSILIISYIIFLIPKNKAHLNEPFTLKVNEATVLENIRFTLLSISEDSRCPLNVQCIFEGRIKAKIKITKNNSNFFQEIISNNQNNIFEDYNIKIEKTEPAPTSGLKINQSDYEVTFKVTK